MTILNSAFDKNDERMKEEWELQQIVYRDYISHMYVKMSTGNNSVTYDTDY